LPPTQCQSRISISKGKKTFTSWGFKNLKDIWTFQDIWNKPKLKDKLKEEIEKKYQSILFQWNKALSLAS